MASWPLLPKFTRGSGGKGGRVNTVVTARPCHEKMIAERILGHKGDSGTGSQALVESWDRGQVQAVKEVHVPCLYSAL
ncbi:hypothetical protein J1614_003022 [Plenodomus biglobosus]|nr:hypothetical protein J1614_003022 [Plenodomus biglobosus]